MFVTPAYAQTGGAVGGPDMILQFLPFILIFVIMYFLIIRPQRTKQKRHQEMVANLRRGDKVVDENEIQVELAENVRVRIVRGMVAEVRAKGEPVKEEG
jgi:preprotein translocase subunit YajC